MDEQKLNELWDAFVAHINETSGYTNRNFIGSIDHYKKLFIEANGEVK